MSGNSREIEIKLRVESRAALLRLLKRLGARPAAGRVHEVNVLFDTPGRRLLRQGKLLRVRVERPARAERPSAKTAVARAGDAVTLTYKGPADLPPAAPAVAAATPGDRRQGPSSRAARYKIREERELRVSSGESLPKILRALGFEPALRYEKYRQPFRLPGISGVRLDFDETPIGDFVELEGNPAAIDRAAALLGYAPPDYIVKGYPALYFEARAMKRTQGERKGSQTGTRTAGEREAPAMLFPRRGR